MEQQLPPAGWYSDPGGEAQLRWWDGQAWTHHLHGSPLQPSGPFTHLRLPSERICVIDCETTGVYRSDRIVEIAIVTLDPSGRVVDEFETLVNPLRDVGPTWLHGVTASMVANAPTFDEIACVLADRLHGTVLAAHNLPFDSRMVGDELRRMGIEPDLGVGLDTLTVTRAKLGIAAEQRGIPLTGAHRALHDARCCAQLLVATACDMLPPARPVALPGVALGRPRVVIRDDAGRTDELTDVPFVAALAHQAAATAVDLTAYDELLERALEDHVVDAREHGELADLAAALGIDPAVRAHAHRRFVGRLIDAAVADGVVTPGELDLLCRTAASLGVDQDVVHRCTEAQREFRSTVPLGGQRVCFTGAATDSRGREIDRDDLWDFAVGLGLTPVASVTAKGCDLLVAADPSSQSGKAAKARQFGVPIASVADFLSARPGGALPVSQPTVRAMFGVCCSRCRGTELIKRRPAGAHLCMPCRKA